MWPHGGASLRTAACRTGRHSNRAQHKLAAWSVHTSPTDSFSEFLSVNSCKKLLVSLLPGYRTAAFEEAAVDAPAVSLKRNDIAGILTRSTPAANAIAAMDEENDAGNPESVAETLEKGGEEAATLLTKISRAEAADARALCQQVANADAIRAVLRIPVDVLPQSTSLAVLYRVAEASQQGAQAVADGGGFELLCRACGGGDTKQLAQLAVLNVAAVVGSNIVKPGSHGAGGDGAGVLTVSDEAQRSVEACADFFEGLLRGNSASHLFVLWAITSLSLTNSGFRTAISEMARELVASLASSSSSSAEVRDAAATCARVLLGGDLSTAHPAAKTNGAANVSEEQEPTSTPKILGGESAQGSSAGSSGDHDAVSIVSVDSFVVLEGDSEEALEKTEKRSTHHTLRWCVLQGVEDCWKKSSKEEEAGTVPARDWRTPESIEDVEEAAALPPAGVSDDHQPCVCGPCYADAAEGASEEESDSGSDESDVSLESESATRKRKVYRLRSRDGPDYWCRYCGARKTHSWGRGPWPIDPATGEVGRLCSAHYQRYGFYRRGDRRKAALDLSPWPELPKVPINPADDSSRKFRMNLKKEREAKAARLSQARALSSEALPDEFPYRLGDAIEFRFSERSPWEPGAVADVLDPYSVDVRLQEGGVREDIDALDLIRCRRPRRAGGRVEVWWDGDKRWYGGVAQTIHENGDIEIQYDDGGVDRVSSSIVRQQRLRNVGDAVEVLESGAKHTDAAAWSRARVAGIGSDGTLDLVCDNGESMLGVDTDRVRGDNVAVAAPAAHKVGDVVRVLWEVDNTWHEATVKAVRAFGKFDVQYVENGEMDTNVAPQIVKPLAADGEEEVGAGAGAGAGGPPQPAASETAGAEKRQRESPSPTPAKRPRTEGGAGADTAAAIARSDATVLTPGVSFTELLVRSARLAIAAAGASGPRNV